MDMCEEVGDSTDPCMVRYADEVYACLKPCIKSTTASCVTDCKNKAEENKRNCEAEQNPSTSAVTTTLIYPTTTVGGGCNHNGQCDTSLGENCEKCRDECPCAGIECMPAKPEARADGCYDPCWNIPHTHYDIRNGKCMCDNGFTPDKDGSKCVSKCPANMVWENTKCACQSVWGDCDNNPENGCESNTQTDTTNCGACGTRCAEHGTCSNGKCGCETGYVADKGGKCVKFGSCNNNTVCESTYGERCYSCRDCACSGGQACVKSVRTDAAAMMHENGCFDCDKDCKNTWGEHALFSRLNEQGACSCICDLGYVMADDKCKMKPKTAIIFVGKFNWWENMWIQHKLMHIREYYEKLGYDVVLKNVNEETDASGNTVKTELNGITEELVSANVDAIAYFGHGGYSKTVNTTSGTKEVWLPTLAGADADNVVQNMNLKLIKAYEDQGMPTERAKELAKKRLSGDSLNLKYAYIHSCNSLNDNSLSKALMAPGGEFWGFKDWLSPFNYLQKPSDSPKNDSAEAQGGEAKS
jgi:hypothetical protein